MFGAFAMVAAWLHFRDVTPAGLCREEFKRHKSADQKFVAGFLAQWQEYADNLTQQPPGHFGADLSAEDAALLNDEQLEQLDVLRTEVASIDTDAAR